MNDEEIFVREVRADPENDFPRLVYADFLEDAGDPRGELIRVQCALAASDVADARLPELRAKEQDLLDEYGAGWLEPLCALGAEGLSLRCFRKGLIERVRITAASFLENGDELCRLAPALSRLDLRSVRESAEALREAAFPPQINELDLRACGLDEVALRHLARAPWMRQIQSLCLQFNRLGDAGVDALLSAAHPQLRQLALDANNLGPDAAEALAQRGVMPALESLSLNVNRLGDFGARHLSDAQRMNSLTSLELASNGIGMDGVGAIASSRAWPALRRLVLRANPLKRQGLAWLGASPEFRELEMLDVRNCGEAPTPELQARFGAALLA